MRSNPADTYRIRLIRHCRCLVLLGLVMLSPLRVHADNGREAEFWDGPPLTVIGLDVQVQETLPKDFNWPGLAKALIGLYLRPDQKLTRENLASAEQALSPFGPVRSDVTVSGQEAEIVFIFSPYKRIKSISIKGNYPLFERDVRNVLGMAVGGIFRPQEVPEEKQRIVQLYQNQGFIDPKVAMAWDTDPRDGYQRLQIDIDTGPYYRLAEVTVTGHRFMDDLSVKGRLAIWRRAYLQAGLGRFEPLNLKKDIDNLTQFYRRSGFYDTQITVEPTLDRQKQTANVAVTIHEGPNYTVAFKGNSFFSERSLGKNLVLEEIGNQGNKGVRRSIQALRRRYLEAGFSDVQVGWEETTNNADENTRGIVFVIEEGPRRIVERLSIHGNKTLDEALIREQILTRPPKGFHKGAYVEQVLQEDIEGVRSLYLQNGFLSTQVAHEVRIDPDSGNVSINLIIDEGVQTRVRNVTIGGESPLSQGELMKNIQMQPGDLYRPYLIPEEENQLAGIIAPMGYPHVQAYGTAELSEDQTRADIVYSVASGPLVTLGELFIAGNIDTRDSFIRRELGLLQGQVFNLVDVLKGQRNVRDLNLFDSVQINSIGLKEKEAAVPLLVTVEEKKPYFFELGGGYQSDKGFYGRTKVGNNNLAGTAKEIWTGAEASQVGYRWDAGFGEPRLLGTRIGLNAGVFTEHSTPFNQDFGSDTTGSSMRLSRTWRESFTTFLGLRYEFRQQFLQNDLAVVEDPAVLEQRAVLVTTPAVSYDSRDAFIAPRKGLFAFLAVDISKGLDNELDDFLKYRADARWFHPVFPKTVLATRIGLGYLQPYGDTTETPQDQLFFLGGTSTVRGFAENLLRQDGSGTAIGGQLAVWASVEGRFQLWPNWELALFVDTGSISQTVEAVGSDDFRWSAGIGLEYITPIGPVGLFYGHKLNPLEGESLGQWHFSIGYTF